MNTGKILFITIFALFCIETEAQKIESWVEANSAVPVEKIYLHTDREYYVRGETIWLKIYLTDSRSGRLIPGPENIYLNLTDKNGEVVLKQLIMSSNGLAHGNIELPVTLNPGKYHLHAFTDYLLSIGKQSFYRQSLQIHSDYNSFATPDENIQQQNNNPYF